ncbi:uncharacterized protein LOC143289916 [Babylonia areolata]|uniref:uncharacterized protein LOC143289916 n=1 Tax=Babylonia areolata TaxID=304850 RepID=UPI003FD3104B
MALHARLFTHNILRASKLKKWSHTAQAIERNSENSTIACCAQTTNATEEEDKLGGDLSPVDSLTQELSSSTLPVCHHPAQKEGPPCLPFHPATDAMTSEKLKALEKSWTGLLFIQEYLPSVVKSVSYTTDDIMACPVDREHHDNHSIVYENHAVTVLTEGRNATQQLSQAARDVSCRGDTRTGGETDFTVLQRSGFRRHSICDSTPTCYLPDSTDCSLLPCRGESHIEAVFSSPVSDQGAALCSSGSGSGGPQGSVGGQKSAGSGGQGPSLDKLRAVEAHFIDSLPKFFKSRLDYSVYHPHIVFENNFWGENQTTVGINQYAIQLTKLRALTHLKYAHVHMEVISSACLLEEGALRIHWRVVGLSQLKALRFWKYTAWSYKTSFRDDAEWIDGISILYVNKDGQVIKHRLDRMTPSEEQFAKTPSLAGKLALLFGVTGPKPSLSDFNSLLCRR